MYHVEQIAILGLRALTGLVFVWSGFAHARDPEGSSRDLGLPKPIVLLVGIVEFLAGLGVAGGLLTRLSAVGLMFVMLGAMHRKPSSGTPDSGAKARKAGTTTCSSSSSTC
jgi:putative oxidoreductase